MTSDNLAPSTFVPFRTSLKDTFRVLQERYESRGALPALPTGFAELDAELLGLWPGDLTLVVSLPGAGATSFALTMLAHAAFDQNKTVTMFSLDLSAEEIALRLVAERSSINLDALRTGRLEDEDWARFSHTITALVDANLLIDDTRALTVSELRSRVLALAAARKLDLVVVDRLQNLRSSGPEGDSATEDGSNARVLRSLARELGVPIVVLSRLDHDPDWLDIHVGGTSQQHVRSPVAHAADTLLYLNRETNRLRPDGTDSTTAWLILARHRRGRRAKIRLEFDGSLGRFSDPDI